MRFRDIVLDHEFYYRFGKLSNEELGDVIRTVIELDLALSLDEENTIKEDAQLRMTQDQLSALNTIFETQPHVLGG